MNPQIGTLTLWSNPVLGIRDNVYNCMNNSAITTLGVGSTFENVTLRSALVTSKISIVWNDANSPLRFTYGRFVGGGATIFYFVTNSTITKNVLHLTLQIDPICTYPNMNVVGITARMHSNQTSPIHNDYLMSYDREDSYMVIQNTENNIGNLLNPTRRFITTNINIMDEGLNNGGENFQLGRSLPIFAGNVNFPIITSPPNIFNQYVMDNTALWELTPLTQGRLEALQGLNMIQSVQHAFQLPQNVALLGTNPIRSIQFENLKTSVFIESGYTGTNQPLRRKTRVSVRNIGTGEEIVNYGWEFGNSETNILVTSALLSPEGNPFTYWGSGALTGIGNLDRIPLSDRLVNHPSWLQAVLDLATPSGEVFASVQSELQRISQEHGYNVQQTNNNLQGRQDEINAIRAHISSIATITGLAQIPANVVGNLAGGNLLGALNNIIGGTGSAIGGGLGIAANTQQERLNEDRLQENIRLASEGNAVALGAINTQEAVRRSVSAQRRSTPASSLRHSSIGQSLAITVTSLHNEDVQRLDRLYNAFGYNIERYVTQIPRPRNIHNFIIFKSVNVSIPDSNQLVGVLAEAMLLQGVRIWNTNPTPQGIYNNF